MLLTSANTELMDYFKSLLLSIIEQPKEFLSLAWLLEKYFY